MDRISSSSDQREATRTLLAFLIYGALSILFFGRAIAAHLDNRIVSAGSHDPSVMIWCLEWFPHALANHLNPFLCKAVWAPTGINLAWITSIPGAAILASPITYLAGPVVSFNLLCLIALPAAAFAAFLLCRYLTGSFWPSIVGGLVYGFSPYFLGHLEAHLVLILAFPIPLATLLVLRLLDGSLPRRIFVALMALLIAIQIGFSLELFATMTALGLIGVGLAYAIGPQNWRDAIRSAAVPLASSYAIGALIVAPYWYYLFAFGMPKGSIISPAGVSSDLLNFMIPTDANLFGDFSIFKRVAARFTFHSEAGAWIPWPLLATIAIYIHARWRTPAGKLMTIMLAMIWIATLGPRLHVGGHTMFGLPWKIIEHLPFLKSALPARLTMYGFLIIAVMTAITLSELVEMRSRKYALAAAAVIFMLPNLSASHWTEPVDLPRFFADNVYRNYLDKDENVLILPYGNRGSSMLWQAYAHMYFRMAGGYTGPAIIDDFQRWPVVNAMYWGIDMPDIAEQLGAFLTAHEVKYVVVQVSRMPTYSPVLAALGELRAEQAYAEPGLQLYRVPPNELAKYREVDPLALEQRWDRYRFDRLVIAADKYLSSGGSLAVLKPSRAKAMKLLPSTWAVDDDIYSRDGLILGPWKDGSVEIGLVGSYDALRPLIDAYRKDAREIYFPFPRPLIAAPKGNLFMRKVVMVFDRAGLERAAAHAAGDISRSRGNQQRRK